MVSPGLRAMLSGVVDYAGLFPPAQLPLDQSIRNYASYRAGPDAWILGRFICPASRLNELSPYVDELFRDGPPLTISALGRGGKDSAVFLDGLRQDLSDISQFCSRHGGRAFVDVIEMRLPLEAFGHSEMVAIARFLETAGQPGMTPFFEPPPMGQDWRKSLVQELAFVGRNPIVPRHVVRHGGFKLRSGGLDAQAFPTTEQVSAVIFAAWAMNVALKFTAGLHHPIRRFDGGVNTKMHGFLNVFVAGVLTSACQINEAAIQQILDDEDSGSFAFDATGLRWRDHRATVAEIEAARRERVISFGSCSFDEPREDLRALGLL